MENIELLKIVELGNQWINYSHEQGGTQLFCKRFEAQVPGSHQQPQNLEEKRRARIRNVSQTTPPPLPGEEEE